MKLTFLGTSAGENYPAIWCHCPNCDYARAHGGKNIRQNSCTLLDDDIMLDLSNHAFQSSLLFGVDLTRMRALLFTHMHHDHVYSHHIIWRTLPINAAHERMQPVESPDIDEVKHWMGSRITPLPHLDIYGHSSVYDDICLNYRYRPELEQDEYNLTFHPLVGGQSVERPDLDLRFTAVESRHGKPGQTLNYIIERGGKTLLYALDCGSHSDESLRIIAAHRYDCVVIEGTFGLMTEEYPSHQNLAKNLRFMEFLDSHGLWKGERRFIITHMSPHWTPPHDEYARIVAPYGMTVAYDGLCVEF